MSLEDTIRTVYSSRDGWSKKRVELRTNQVMDAVDRRRLDLKTWLNPGLNAGGRFLDLGCGAGMLVAAAGAEGFEGMGIDVSMEWLVVARKLIEEWGSKPVLAAAMAECLPLEDGGLDNVISLDVIEHVGDMERYMVEIARVTRDNGAVLVTTPNRYSLTPEPHVFVWGVGLVPRRFQKSYVEWVSGKSYEYTKLLSFVEISSLFKRSLGSDYSISPGQISEVELESFSSLKRQCARIYNHFLTCPSIRSALLPISPYFVVHARKRRSAPGA